MRFFKLLAEICFVSFGYAVVCTHITAVSASTNNPHRLFAQAQRAAGGDAWNRVAEIAERGTVHVGDTEIPYHLFVDCRAHRFVYVQGDLTRHGFGYDADGEWAVENGFVQPLTAPADTTFARTVAYIARNGWWNPQNDPAVMSYAGRRTQDGRVYATIRVTPKGGLPLLVFIDATTHLIAEVQQFDLYNITTTVKLGAYHRLQGVQYPVARTLRDNGRPNYTQYTKVTDVTLLSQVRNKDFARPANHLTGVIAGGSSTTVPFSEDNPEFPFIVVTARINGSRPLHLVLDSGGRNTITPAIAKELGLHVKPAVSWSVGFGAQKEGFASHIELTLGKAALRDQRFWVVPCGPFVTYTTSRYTIDGGLGYELLRNFVVTIDYQHHVLVLTKPASFAAKNVGIPIHFLFTSIGRWLAASASPVISMNVGKRDGFFLVDTGNAEYATMNDTFLRSAGFNFPRYKPVTIRSWYGDTERLLRIPSTQIPPFTLKQPVFMLEPGTGRNMLASLDGDIGSSVWSRFTVTFDYAHATMYLRPAARFNKPFFGIADGLSYTVLPNLQRQVMSVIPHSPGAQAGIRVGDTVLAVNGIPSEKVGRSDIYNIEMTHRVITMKLRRGKKVFIRTIHLQEMLP